MAMGEAEPPISVLVMSHDARDMGGVGNYLKVMKHRLRPTTIMHRFVSGKRHSETSTFDKIKRLITDYARFIGVVTKRHFDVVHFNPEMDLRSFPRESLFMMFLILIGKRYIVFHHGWNWDEFKIIVSRPLLRRWLFFALNRASRVIVCSRSFRDGLIEHGVRGEHIMVITSMFDGRLLRPRSADNPIDLENPTLLFMARFVKEKGIYELVEAVALLKEEFPRLRLIMGGDGVEMEGLKARAKALGVTDQVLFPGYVRGKQKAQVFTDATIFVLPSYFWEGLPNAALEAMGSGLPVISTRNAGLPEVMDDPDNGFFLEKVTPEDIAEKVRTMLRDPEYMMATSRRNQEKAWQRFEAAVVSRQVEDVYRAVRDDRPAGGLSPVSAGGND